MLTEAYIEALLVDEELADQVWKLWDAGLVSDDLASLAWWLVWILNQACRTHDLPDPWCVSAEGRSSILAVRRTRSCDVLPLRGLVLRDAEVVQGRIARP